jgi:hypothetical protein
MSHFPSAIFKGEMGLLQWTVGSWNIFLPERLLYTFDSPSLVWGKRYVSEQSEVKSENARNVILTYGESVYFVNRVNVQVSEGKDLLKAIFHARRVADNQPEDINVEIKPNIRDVLVEYAKMDKLDLILVLQIQGNDAKWCLMSENWLKNQTPEQPKKTSYIV